MNRRRLPYLPIAAWLFLASFAAVAENQIVGVASVIDGDTLEIRGARVRLHGIDAPESTQLCFDKAEKPWRCGQRASLALADRIGRATVTCRRTDTDRYGRMVARCYKGGKDLSAWLVAEGWAVAFRRYSGDYVEQEGRAKAAGRNIWAGQFMMPWDWRQGQRIAATKPATDSPRANCNIKGNINRRGEHIYHVPGDQFYKRTKISESKGERWFCSEKEARAAGWRRSER